MFVFGLIIYSISTKTKRTGNYSIELESCMNSYLDKFKELKKSKNFVDSDWSLTNEQDNGKLNIIPDASLSLLEQQKINQETLYTDAKDDLYLPYAGNGYIGVSLISKQGLYGSYQKGLQLQLKYNPLTQIYSETLKKKEMTGIDLCLAQFIGYNAIRIIETVLQFRVYPMLIELDHHYSSKKLPLTILQKKPFPLMPYK
jgi:hypothetical protein